MVLAYQRMPRHPAFGMATWQLACGSSLCLSSQHSPSLVAPPKLPDWLLVNQHLFTNQYRRTSIWSFKYINSITLGCDLLSSTPCKTKLLVELSLKSCFPQVSSLFSFSQFPLGVSCNVLFQNYVYSRTDQDSTSGRSRPPMKLIFLSSYSEYFQGFGIGPFYLNGEHTFFSCPLLAKKI